MTLADFDGVTYHVSTTPESKSILILSMAMRCYNELKEYGANDVLKRVYGDRYMETPETGYDVSLKFDQETLPPSDTEKGLNIICLFLFFDY